MGVGENSSKGCGNIGILAWNAACDFIGAYFSSFLYAKLSKHQNQSVEAEN